jgi:hypothetical protein
MFACVLACAHTVDILLDTFVAQTYFFVFRARIFFFCEAVGWAPICADNNAWTIADANVTCMEMGLSGAAVANIPAAGTTISAPGQPFSCLGGEMNLGTCPRGSAYSLMFYGHCSPNSVTRTPLGTFTAALGGVAACAAAANNFAMFEYFTSSGQCRGLQVPPPPPHTHTHTHTHAVLL